MIVLDAGHGGSDPGSSGNGIVEKDYTLMITKYLGDRFKELGVPVTLTRTTDETLTPEERVSRILNAYGDSPDVLVISSHLNAGGGDGAEVIYALRNKDTLSRMILEEMAKEGQNIRKWYQRRLPSDTSKDYYFLHRNTGRTEPVIVEYGFLDSTGDDVNQIKNNWRDLAEAVVRAVAMYKGIPYDKGLEAGNYQVQKGDSLWSIAKKFNVGVEALKQANGLTSNTINVGQFLKIPGYVPPTQSTTTYVVQKGDSLWSIATAFDVTVAALKQANNLVSNDLSVGQELSIPGVSTTPSVPSIPPVSEENTYTVKSGDSLWSIANRFGVSVTELRSLNNLTSDALSIGQILLIPVTTTPPPEGTTYTVVKGDSLWSIANKYGVSVNQIMTANNLASSSLSVGQVLAIPVPGETSPVGGETYVVKSGDSLWSISSKFGISVDRIMSANNLTNTNLSIGQVLKIPGASGDTTPTGPQQGETIRYTVAKGDSLYSIASRYGTTSAALMALNDLSNSLLSIGQILLIPAPESSNITYVVKSGDSLWSIAQRFNVTVNELRIANGLKSDLLDIGQTLQIP